MNLLNKQKGLSSIGWLFVGVTVFFYAIILTKIMPIYLDDMTVKNSFEKIKITSDSLDPTPEVILALEKQFSVEDIDDIDLRKEGIIKVERKGGVLAVEMNYQKNATIFSNSKLLQTMDVVIKFKHTKELR